MTTLIEHRRGDGSLAGRCDAKCYNAEHPKCECICGGMNHGIGKSDAMKKTDAHYDELAERYKGNGVLWIQMNLF